MTAEPEFVYHYTDQSGLLGILKSRELWCTHIAYMNDALEYIFPRTLYEEMLEMFESDPEPRIREYAAEARHWLRHSVPSGTTSPMAEMIPFHVACFSEKGDDLSQWRAYGGVGARFPIGFRVQALKMLALIVDRDDTAMYNTGADALTSIPWVAAFIFWSPSLHKG